MRKILILAMIFMVAACTGGGSVKPVQRKPFDTLLFYNKPNIPPGMDGTMLMLYGNNGFWIYNKRLASLGSVEGTYEDETKIAKVAKAAWAAGYRKICIDREDGNNLGIRLNIAEIRKAVPAMKIGVFCFPAIYYNWTHEYTRSVNDQPEIKAILKACDFSTPGIDLRWEMGNAEGRATWLAFLKIGLSESARTMPGKPCYPFLPIEYNPVLKDDELSPEELTWQLRQTDALGVQPILWGGFLKEWDKRKSVRSLENKKLGA